MFFLIATQRESNHVGGLWIVKQLDALNSSNIFICLSHSTCFGYYVPIIRRDPMALTQLLYLSFRRAVYLVSTIGSPIGLTRYTVKRNDKYRSCVSVIGSLLMMGT
jgi:hypothetical protein